MKCMSASSPAPYLLQIMGRQRAIAGQESFSGASPLTSHRTLTMEDAAVTMQQNV